MRDSGPVIGRDSEIREVTETLLSTGASARTLLVLGGAGSGKTAVLEQARRAVVEDGAKVLRLRCQDGGSPPGAGALADGVHRAITKIHNRRSPVRIGATRRIRLHTAGHKGELTLLSALSDLLADTAARGPFALLVDDVERMPSATASALGLLLRVFRPAGVPVVLAGRAAHPPGGGTAQLTAAADRLLELPPLRPADVESLVEWRLGRPVEPALVTGVLGALGPMAGTPEAVLSVLDAMEERGHLLELGGQMCLTEPGQALRLTTDAAVLSRLCRPGAPPDAVALDAAAAVARHLEHAEIRLDDLHRLKPGGPRRAGLVDRTLTPLVGDGILTVDGDGRIAFAVPALAAALRTRPTSHHVPSLHALIIRSLTDRLGAETAGGAYPRLTEHVAAAGAELEDALAVDLLLAAARTDARTDWPRSVRAYSSALRRLTPDDPRTPAVLRESAELSLRHADHAGALALGEPLLAHLDVPPADKDGDGPEYVAEVWALAALHEHRPPCSQDAGLDVLERVPAVVGFAALAGPYGLAPVTRRTVTHRTGTEAHRVPAADPRAGSGPLPSPAELRLLASAAAGRTDLLAALDALPPDAHGPNGPHRVDRLRNAATHADLADALAAVLGDRYTGPGHSTAAQYHAMVRSYLKGDWDRALASARRIEARSRTGGTAAGAAHPARALAAEIHCTRGELGHARAWLELIPDTVAHPLVAWVRLGLRYWSGQVTKALEGARADVRRARESGLLAGVERVLLRCLTYALLEDRPEVMREVLAELEALHEEVDSPMTREAALLGRGLVHRDVDGALAALRSVRERGDVYLGLLCRMCLVEIGDDGDRPLAEASRIAQALGVGRVTRTTLGHMTRRRSRVPQKPRPAADELSEEDVQLTAMVSRGATNRQIAARLAWSEKTVERRLTQLFQRTGCRSRVELAAAWLDGSLAGRDRLPDVLSDRMPGVLSDQVPGVLSDRVPDSTSGTP